MRAAALFLLVTACATEPALEGKVVDVWGHPIEGATVMMVGLTERPLTDAEGRYRLPRVSGKHQVKAGKEGYIQQHREVEITEGASGPLFELYRKPPEAGYYLVTTGSYVRLEPQVVQSVGNELASHRGLKAVGDARTDRPPQVILHTELKLDEISRLGLELHRLKFDRMVELQGPLASQEVKVNLYSSAGEVPIEVRPLNSPTDYLIEPQGTLEPGYYAFQTQDLLDTHDPESFRQIPEALRVVFPFEFR